MSTRPQPRPDTGPTETDTTEPSLPFAVGNAPVTFSPDNTDPCPEMFSTKWTDTTRTP